MPGCSFDAVKKGMEGAGVDEAEVVEMFIFLFKTLKELKSQGKEGAFIDMLQSSKVAHELSLLLKQDQVREILFSHNELASYIEENPDFYIHLSKGTLENASSDQH